MKGNIRSENIRGTSKANRFEHNARHSWLGRYGHVKRWGVECVGRKLLVMKVPEKGRR